MALLTRNLKAQFTKIDLLFQISPEALVRTWILYTKYGPMDLFKIIIQ